MIDLFCVTSLLFSLTGASNGKLIQVAPGSDVAVSCGDSKSGWSPIRTSSIELRLENTVHLLVQNFQPQQDKGLYRCGTEGSGTPEEVTLEEKSGSTDDTTTLYRALGQSAHLFCKHLGSEWCQGRWTWTSHHGSTSPYIPGTMNGRRDNDFSRHLSSVTWADAGTFQCQMTCSRLPKKTSYELIVVEATVDPQHVPMGRSVKMCCSVSHWKTSDQVCWVKLHSDNNRLYNGYQKHCWHESHPSFCYFVDRMSPEENVWACAVFHENTLRALLPVHVNVSKHTTTPEPTTHTMTPRRVTTTLQTTRIASVMDTRDTMATTHSSAGVRASHVCLMAMLGLVVLVLVILTAVLLCTRRKGVDVCEDEEDEIDGCAEEGSSDSDSVTYTEVHFKRKPPEDLSKGVASAEPLTDDTGNDVEDNTVIYAGLKMSH